VCVSRGRACGCVCTTLTASSRHPPLAHAPAHAYAHPHAHAHARAPATPRTHTTTPARCAHLAIKAVHLVHAVALVVAAREVHCLRVQHLPRQQADDDLRQSRVRQGAALRRPQRATRGTAQHSAGCAVLPPWRSAASAATRKPHARTIPRLRTSTLKEPRSTKSPLNRYLWCMWRGVVHVARRGACGAAWCMWRGVVHVARRGACGASAARPVLGMRGRRRRAHARTPPVNTTAAPLWLAHPPTHPPTHPPNQPTNQPTNERTTRGNHTHTHTRTRTHTHDRHVRVVRRGQPVELPDVQQVVELPVHVAAHREVRAARDGHVHERRELLEQLARLAWRSGVCRGVVRVCGRVRMSGGRHGGVQPAHGPRTAGPGGLPCQSCPQPGVQHTHTHTHTKRTCSRIWNTKRLCMSRCSLNSCSMSFKNCSVIT
jgi:hypothetical protein